MNSKQPKNRATHEPDRVRRHTAPEVQDPIDLQNERSIRFYAAQPREAITARIEELEREWDIERYLTTNAAALAFSSASMGLLRGRKWFLLTATVLGFLAQHALSGWCPPVEIFRRLGARTRNEIDREKFALKTLRGDFKGLSPTTPERPGSGKPPKPGKSALTEAAEI